LVSAGVMSFQRDVAGLAPWTWARVVQLTVTLTSAEGMLPLEESLAPWEELLTRVEGMPPWEEIQV